MTPSEWRQVEELYHRALERAAGERAAFLATECGSDEPLRREVLSLLAHAGEAERRFLMDRAFQAPRTIWLAAKIGF